MMAHRLCVALSFFYIGLWRAAPLRAAQAASTPGDSAAVTGQVIASETRAPIGGATVQVMGTRLTTSTDSAGRFALGGLPPGVVVHTRGPQGTLDVHTGERVDGEHAHPSDQEDRC